MGEKISNPNIFHFMNDPSVFGGSNYYKDILKNNNYIGKYSKYISDHSTIPFTVYREHKMDGSFDLVYYHFQVESEKNSEIIYDVVFKFSSNEASTKSEKDIKNYKVQFFSNSPGFLFQFAYVYNKHNLLIPELTKQIGDKALMTPPSKSNTHLAVGYDYTIFYCIRFLYLNQFYVTKKEILRKGKPINQFDTNNIPSANEVLERRSPKEIINFKKLKRSFLGITAKPKELISSIGSSIGLTKPRKAKSAHRAIHARSAKGPNKPK